MTYVHDLAVDGLLDLAGVHFDQARRDSARQRGVRKQEEVEEGDESNGGVGEADQRSRATRTFCEVGM